MKQPDEFVIGLYLEHGRAYAIGINRGINLSMLANGGGLATCVGALSNADTEPKVVHILVLFMCWYLAGLFFAAVGLVASTRWVVDLDRFVKVNGRDGLRGKTLEVWRDVKGALRGTLFCLSGSTVCFFFETDFGLMQVTRILG